MSATRPIPCGHCGRKGCPACHRHATDPVWRAFFGGDPADAKGAPPLQPRDGPCRFEGDVVELSARGCEKRHIRQCLYEGHDFERCVRGRSGSAEVQSCETCDFWRSGSVSGGP